MFRMRVRHVPLGVIALALPLAVDVDVPQDSSMTQLRVAGGGGHYLAVIRDCDGNATDKAGGSFYDVAAGIDHKFRDSPLAIGVSGGYLHDENFPADSTSTGVITQKPDGGCYYVTPSIGLMWRRFGVSLGATYFSRQLLNPDDVQVTHSSVPLVGFEDNASEWLPSAAIRIGPASGFHFTASGLSAFPMYSGGGYFEMGFGDHVSDRAALWGGISILGMTATGFQSRVQLRVVNQLYFDAAGSFGQREGETQYAGSIGVTYRMVH